MSAMDRVPRANPRQFSLHDLILFVGIMAMAAAMSSYLRPGRPALVLSTAGISMGAMAVMLGVSRVAGRHGWWLRPLTVLLTCAGAFAVGIWMQRYF